jgi:hypothetical protein
MPTLDSINKKNVIVIVLFAIIIFLLCIIFGQAYNTFHDRPVKNPKPKLCTSCVVIIKSIGLQRNTHPQFKVVVEYLDKTKNCFGTYDLVYSIGDTIWMDIPNEQSWKLRDDINRNEIYSIYDTRK